MNNVSRTGVFELRLSENKNEIGYLRLPTYPKGNMKVSKSIRLFDIMGTYQGPDVIFDFDADEMLVGIEIITDDGNDDSIDE